MRNVSQFLTWAGWNQGGAVVYKENTPCLLLEGEDLKRMLPAWEFHIEEGCPWVPLFTTKRGTYALRATAGQSRKHFHYTAAVVINYYHYGGLLDLTAALHKLHHHALPYDSELFLHL